VRAYLDRRVRQLIRRGVKSGLIEGSNLWLSIGALAWLFRFLTRKSAPQVTIERLRLGESVVVSHVPAPPRSRRAKKKAAKQLAKQERSQAKRQAKMASSRRYVRSAARAASEQAAEQEALSRKADRAAKKHSRRKRRVSGEHIGEGDVEATA
jgi:hypothetical protein